MPYASGEKPMDPVRDSFEQALAPYGQHELDPDELTILHSADVRRLQPAMLVRTERAIINGLTESSVRVFRRATGLIALHRSRQAFVDLEERRYHGQIVADGNIYEYNQDRPIYQATACLIGKGTAIHPDAMARYTCIPSIGYAEKSFYSRISGANADAPHKIFDHDHLRLTADMSNREAAGAIAVAAESRRRSSELDILSLPHDSTLGVVLPSDWSQDPTL